MDSDAERTHKENAEKAVKAYLAHPISKDVADFLETQEQRLISTIVDLSVDSLGAFFAHFEAVGHLRGIRSVRNHYEGAAEEYKEKASQVIEP